MRTNLSHFPEDFTKLAIIALINSRTGIRATKDLRFSRDVRIIVRAGVTRTDPNSRTGITLAEVLISRTKERTGDFRGALMICENLG